MFSNNIRLYSLFHFRVFLVSVLLFLFCVTNPVTYAQQSIRDSCIRFGLVSVGYGGYFPGSTMAERFGYTNLFHIEGGYKFKNNIYFSLGEAFMFGETVKETDMFDHLSFQQTWKMVDGSDYRIYGWIDGNGNIFYPAFEQRGFVIPLRVGYIFNKLRFGKLNPNSGVFVEVGTQFIQHSIFFKAIPEKTPYLEGDMLKGYDRLCNGIGTIQSIGYKYFSNNRFLNFYLAFDCSQNFTQSRRSVDYDTGLYDARQRMDLLIGFRAGWSFPIYRTAPEKYYYY